MERSRFLPNSPGRIVRALRLRESDPEIDAFVPDALPPGIELNNDLFNATARVANALGRLQGTARSLPDPRILIRSFVRREAQLSSYIENTFARYDDVAAADQHPGTRRRASDDVRETLNAEKAIDVGVAAVFDGGYPITNNLLRQMHGVLMTGVRGEECAGHFRGKQVYIGNQHDGIARARFVPPPPMLLGDLMEDFERFVRSTSDLPALIQIALTHYQFETIHPFEDGNGRLGRILILLGLCQHGLLTIPLINASLHFERHRQGYYDALLAVSTDGDWNGWFLFFLEGIRVAAEESLTKLAELIGLQKRYHDAVRSVRNTSLLLTLVDHLFVLPAVTVSDAARIMGVSYQAAQNSVKKLVDAGILSPRQAVSPATFVAREVLDALNPNPTRR